MRIYTFTCRDTHTHTNTDIHSYVYITHIICILYNIIIYLKYIIIHIVYIYVYSPGTCCWVAQLGTSGVSRYFNASENCPKMGLEDDFLKMSILSFRVI